MFQFCTGTRYALSEEEQERIADRLGSCPDCGSKDLYVFRYYAGAICRDCGTRITDDGCIVSRIGDPVRTWKVRERMTDFNYVKCDYCGFEARREGHYRILEGWLRVDAQSRGWDGELCLNPCQIDACPNCIRKHPVLLAMYETTRDPGTDIEKIIKEGEE